MLLFKVTVFQITVFQTAKRTLRNSMRGFSTRFLPHCN